VASFDERRHKVSEVECSEATEASCEGIVLSEASWWFSACIRDSADQWVLVAVQLRSRAETVDSRRNLRVAARLDGHPRCR
jgi:hypothetical protein